MKLKSVKQSKAPQLVNIEFMVGWLLLRWWRDASIRIKNFRPGLAADLPKAESLLHGFGLLCFQRTVHAKSRVRSPIESLASQFCERNFPLPNGSLNFAVGAGNGPPLVLLHG